MRKILATACLCLSVISPAFAADKGTPAPAAPAGTVVESDAPRWGGMYLEGSGTMFNVETTGLGGATIGMMGLGVGWDHRIAGTNFLVGAFGRYDFAIDDMSAQSISIGARGGVLLNPYLLAYLPIAYTMSKDDISLNNGIWSVGVGVETYLGSRFTVFAEMTRSVSLAGDAKLMLDEATTARAGLKLRF